MLVGLNKEVFLAYAGGGLVAGIVAAVLVAGGPSTQAERPSGVSTESPGAVPAQSVVDPAEEKLKPVLNALADAHKSLHGKVSPEAKSTGLPDEMQDAILENKSYLEILMDFHRRVGPGALVKYGRLTKAGEAVMKAVGSVAEHGLSQEHYPLQQLQSGLKALPKPEGAKAVEAPSGSGAAGVAILKILRGSAFNPKAALEQLKEAGGAPTVELVKTLRTALEKNQKLPDTPYEEYQFETHMARALMFLVLDFRIFRRAGPFIVTRKSEKFALYKKRPKKAAKLMAGIVMAADPGQAIRDLEPPFPSYRKLVGLLKTYRGYAEKACHQKLPVEWRLYMGRSGEQVKALQARLACEGYYAGAVDGIFDEDVKEAVITYQRHHSLNAEGYVKKATLRSMNIPLDFRANQIALVLQRMRESEARDLGETFIRVNVPAFQLEYFYKGKVLRRHDVIVGTNRLDDNKLALIQGHLNRTQLFTTSLYEVIVNPDWILPQRVEKGEVATKLAADPNYLKKNNIRRITLPSGRRAMVQGRGPLNVLGRVKFLLKRSNAIFLHDTNDRSLFRHSKRDLSHGCMRVKYAVDFAKWILKRDGWDPKDVKRSFRAQNTQRGMKLKKPVPLITEYMTVSVSEEGRAVFYYDVYGYDADYFAKRLPSVTKVLWGGAKLRPHWVPRVNEKIVKSWKAAGKAAPRKYDPKIHGGG